MKKIFLIFALTIISQYAQSFTWSCFYNGYWGKWEEAFGYEAYGNYSGFVIYTSSNHPSEYVFKFQIDTSIPPQVRMEGENGKERWYHYQGTVEYYVSEDYPTIVDVLKTYGHPYIHPSSYSSGPIAKRIARAEIKTWKRPWNDKRHPNCYNFVFDGIAVGIDKL